VVEESSIVVVGTSPMEELDSEFITAVFALSIEPSMGLAHM
jgi:hypothetical protein